MSTIKVGNITVTPLLDGTGRECARDVLQRDGDASAWDEHPQETDADGDLHLTLGGFLVRTADRVVLVDAGVGTIDNGRYRGGLLLEQLREQGLDAGDVTDVAFTHLHFDHVGWATQKGEVVFENATHHVHSADWDFFVDDVNSDPGAVRKLAPLQARLDPFATGKTLAPGLDARPAVGHTPGSTVYVISARANASSCSATWHTTPSSSPKTDGPSTSTTRRRQPPPRAARSSRSSQTPGRCWPPATFPTCALDGSPYRGTP